MSKLCTLKLAIHISFGEILGDLELGRLASECARHALPLTLSDPGYFRQLTIRGGGALKARPPPLRSRKLFCQSSPYHTCEFDLFFRHDPVGIFQKFAILTTLQRFQNKK